MLQKSIHSFLLYAYQHENFYFYIHTKRPYKDFQDKEKTGIIMSEGNNERGLRTVYDLGGSEEEVREDEGKR